MPKFLMRWLDARRERSKIANAIKAGDKSKRSQTCYNEFSEILQDQATAKRHADWQKLYDNTYRVEKEKNLAAYMKPEKARFQANLKAQSVVAHAYKVNRRAVRKAIITYE